MNRIRMRTATILKLTSVTLALLACCMAPQARAQANPPTQGTPTAQAGPPPAAGAARAASADWPALGKAVIGELASRQFAKAEARFDEAMTAALPAGKLAGVWDSLLAHAGAFQAITGTRVEPKQTYHIVFVTCRFERASLDLEVSFNSGQRIAGLHVLPAAGPEAPKTDWTPPSYAHPAAFHERSVTVGADPWKLPGTLTLPNRAGPFPAVVLVHGSGPEDEDETIGPNKPFKDLAWGLASRGIAVLRYNKRTLEHPVELQQHFAGFTVMDETVNDARAAVALAAAQPEIDPKQVYVLGHSLGGTLAPRIALGDPQVTGIILMAGGARPLEKVIVEQLKYIASIDPDSSKQAAKQIEQAEQTARQIESPGLKPGDTVSVLGAKTPGSYWLDLRSYHAGEVAARLKIPILVLQGGRDYQVTREDFDLWKAALAHTSKSPRATFKLYPGLFHLFMPSTTPGSGLGTPADYEKSGHIAEPVINDIAAWVRSSAHSSQR
ncbi:MAG TPA: alpha/beta fold hydrolase [Terriglobia bacterium]|nr:alpha/beta fold hydrolase [Terriglobia bacterium]